MRLLTWIVLFFVSQSLLAGGNDTIPAGFVGGEKALNKYIKSKSVWLKTIRPHEGCNIWVLISLDEKNKVVEVKTTPQSSTCDAKLNDEAISLLKFTDQWKTKKFRGKALPSQLFYHFTCMKDSVTTEKADLSWAAEMMTVQYAQVGLAEEESTVEPTTMPPADENEIYTIVEEMAEFPGGMTALYKHIASNIKYPAIARENGLTGKCFIKFVVTKEGKVTKPVVLKGVPGCPECDAEALRVLNELPAWKPARQQGKNVSVYFTLPVVFKMTDPPPAQPAEKQMTREEIEKHDQAMVYYNAGHKLDQEGKHAKALEKFDLALKQEPGNKYALFDKARMHLALGEKQKACEIWNKMVSMQLRKEEAEEFIKKHCN